MTHGKKRTWVFYTLFVYFVAGSLPVRAGDPVDSLIRTIQTAKPDSNKAKTLHRLAWKMYERGEYIQAMDYATRSMGIRL